MTDFTNSARAIIDPTQTAVVIPGVPAGATVQVQVYAEDVYGQQSNTVEDSIDTPVEQVTLTDPNNGVPVITTNTDPNIGAIGAQAFLRSEWQRWIRNGDFHEAPPTTSATINNTNNVLPGWLVNDSTSGAATAQYIPDATVGSGGYIEWFWPASTSGHLYLEQGVGARSTATRNVALQAIASIWGDAGTHHTSGQFEIHITLIELDVNNTVLGTYSDASWDFSDVAVFPADISDQTVPSLNAATTTILVRIGITSDGSTAGTLHAKMYDCAIDDNGAGSLYPNLGSPNTNGIRVFNPNGNLNISGTIAPTGITFPSSSLATPAIVLGSAAAAGSAGTVIRSDATIAAFDATAPTTSAVGDAAATGSAAKAARRDHLHGRESFGSSAAAIGTSAGGSATTPSHSDHVHATGAGTPTTIAYGDAAATGTGPAAAMTDHRHGAPSSPVIPAFATPAVVLGTAAAAGAASTVIRSDSTILAFDATAPTTSAVGDAAATGSQAVAARRDHLHGREAFAAPTAETTFGGSSATGSATTLAHSDHAHGNPDSTTGPDADVTIDATGAAGTIHTAARSAHGHKLATYSSAAAAIGTAAAGTSTTAPSRGDHVHATGAGTPSTQAFGDAAATGTGPAAAMTDHKHAWPAGVVAGAMPALTGDTTSSAGSVATTTLKASTTWALTGIITPTQLVANTDNWAPTALPTAGVIRVSTDASRNLTGLTGGADGRIIKLLNIGSFPLVLKHSVTSTAANRFLCHNDADETLPGDSAVELIYDGSSARWRVSSVDYGTPTTQAFGDSAVAGTTETHKHGMPANPVAYAAPALTLGTSNSAGAASSAVRTDATILAFDATTPAAVGTAAVGAATVAARRDHVHATGAGTPSTQAFGDSASTGSGPAAAMTDHKHAMPAGLLASNNLSDIGNATAARGNLSAASTSQPVTSFQTTGGNVILGKPTALGGSVVEMSPSTTKTLLAITESDVASLTTDLAGKSANPHGAADHTNITRYIPLYAADAKLDSGTAVTLGASPDQLPAVAFADAVTQGCYWAFLVPADWDSGNLFAQPIWSPGSTDASSHAVQFTTRTKILSGGTDVTSAGTNGGGTGAAAARTASQIVTGDTSWDLGVAPSAAGQMVMFELRRAGANVSDTYVGVVNIVSVRISYTANQ